MKYLKTYSMYIESTEYYKLFESQYSIEEYIDYIVKALGKFDVSPVDINRILDGYEDVINTHYESGEMPKILSDQIISELDLSNDNGFLPMNTLRPAQTTIKYL